MILARALLARIARRGSTGLERDYATYLDMLLRARMIDRYDQEPESLRLADRTFFLPDFRVILPDGQIEFHECKGHWEDDARAKFKIAAAQHPYIFRAVTRVKGAWSWETLPKDAPAWLDTP